LDVKHTPCARGSLINGIIGGLTVGMLYFLKSSEGLLWSSFPVKVLTGIFFLILFTSDKVTRSCDFAVGGFLALGYGSW